MKTTTYVEYQGIQIDTNRLLSKVKEGWNNEDKEITDISSINIYVKPEDNMVYYIINEEFFGSLCLN